MYLTAQHVVGDRGDGINAFLFTHTGPPDPEEREIDWERPDVSFVAERAPGKLALELIEVSPGQNEVFSYLDAVTPEGALALQFASEIQRAIAEYPAQPGEERLPFVWRNGRTTLRYYCSPRIRDDATELRSLSHKALLLLGVAAQESGTKAPAPPDPNPLVAVGTTDEYGVRYALDSASRGRLMTLRPGASLPASIGAAHDVSDDFRRMLGPDVYREYALALTGMTIPQLNAVAGIQFRDALGKILWDSRRRV